MNNEPNYEVLSPWADADPVLRQGLINPRINSLNGKKIGLFHNIKRAGGPILKVVERRLQERFNGISFDWYEAQSMSVSAQEPQNIEKSKAWISGVDAVILAVAD
jgi:hypothetical protein